MESTKSLVSDDDSQMENDDYLKGCIRFETGANNTFSSHRSHPVGVLSAHRLLWNTFSSPIASLLNLSRNVSN